MESPRRRRSEVTVESTFPLARVVADALTLPPRPDNLNPMARHALDRSDGRTNLLDLTPAQASDAIAAFLATRGEPAYRLKQIVPALWQLPVRSFQEVTTLPQALLLRALPH